MLAFGEAGVFAVGGDGLVDDFGVVLDWYGFPGGRRIAYGAVDERFARGGTGGLPHDFPFAVIFMIAITLCLLKNAAFAGRIGNAGLRGKAVRSANFTGAAIPPAGFEMVRIAGAVPVIAIIMTQRADGLAPIFAEADGTMIIIVAGLGAGGGTFSKFQRAAFRFSVYGRIDIAVGIAAAFMISIVIVRLIGVSGYGLNMLRIAGKGDISLNKIFAAAADRAAKKHITSVNTGIRSRLGACR